MYRFSFFFWPAAERVEQGDRLAFKTDAALDTRMDLLGTLSMAFEISFLLGQYLNSNTVRSLPYIWDFADCRESVQRLPEVVLRTARTAKLGARIGRLIKLVKMR